MSGPIQLSDVERKIVAQSMVRFASARDIRQLAPAGLAEVLWHLKRAVQLLEGCEEE